MQFVLMLPLMADHGDTFYNHYYCIGHRWTERVSDGTFVEVQLSKETFCDWTTDVTNNNEGNS